MYNVDGNSSCKFSSRERVSMNKHLDEGWELFNRAFDAFGKGVSELVKTPQPNVIIAKDEVVTVLLHSWRQRSKAIWKIFWHGEVSFRRRNGESK